MKIKITVILVILLSFSNLCRAQHADLQLSIQPVVIKGDKLPMLAVYKPGDLVGFKYTTKWEQIIIQIDEMKKVTGAQIYNNAGTMKTANPADSWDGGINLEYDYDGKTGGKNSFLVYADANTFTGPDENILFDDNDELVYMARDGGTIPPGDELFPLGIDHCSGVQIRNTDPVTGLVSYIYIFRRDLNYKSPLTGNALQQDAGLTHPVTYNFNFKRNNITRGPADYKEYYNRQFGPNPETSTVVTPHYIKGFGDRWIENSLIITTPATQGMLESARQNVLDGHKLSLIPLNVNQARTCHRNEYTFSGTANDDQTRRPLDGTEATSRKGYEGAFIANINGPLRCIRSFMGCNSGPLTQRDNICYDQMEVINTYLRVHPIDGIMDFYDYAPLAGKMIYNNNNNMPGTSQTINGHAYTGILIDGKNDVVKPGLVKWEMINSTSGSIFRYNLLHNPENVTGVFESTYYYDSDKPDSFEPQCTGDAVAWGASGITIRRKDPLNRPTALPNTEIRFAGDLNRLWFTQYNMYLQPETQLSERVHLINSIEKKIDVSITAWQHTADCENRKRVAVELYPNPSNGKFTLDIGGSVYQKVKMTIYDTQGKLVFHSDRVGQINETIDISRNISSGIYIMQLDIDGQKVARKIIITDKK
ncbi:hypothetical protein DJ568_07210 [Mucilaginibacter hurinus]|uniref:Secretion system C-terminal sorting domain-containing protein n=1 Tax=Mucilaginibacter hurinus TaxID=2201324 RepID=A0A367GRG9_9SPHI|nr:T9SS type A sorting domain-containing protein [Mucilaginibacter hurinus]RCH55668.1 hypothetical protein DJ568_07210 [Mucilaginibacter hurinus]